MSADTNDTLFERPNVAKIRVVRTADPSMCPSRESASGGTRNAGAAFFGVRKKFFFCNARGALLLLFTGSY